MSINVRLKHKKDTAANWNSKNPVLLDGEIVLVDDNGTLRIKMGDGLTNFKLLPYFDAPMHAHIDNQNNPHKVTKSQVGLGNVDNTADADKSVNYATSSGHAITADGLTNVTATASELNVLDGITASTSILAASPLSSKVSLSARMKSSLSLLMPFSSAKSIALATGILFLSRI